MRLSNGLVTSIEKLENASVGVERSVGYGVIVARRSLINSFIYENICDLGLLFGS